MLFAHDLIFTSIKYQASIRRTIYINFQDSILDGIEVVKRLYETFTRRMIFTLGYEEMERVALSWGLYCMMVNTSGMRKKPVLKRTVKV